MTAHADVNTLCGYADTIAKYTCNKKKTYTAFTAECASFFMKFR